MLQSSQKTTKEAIKTINKIKEPKAENYHLELANAYIKLNKPQEAIKYLKKVRQQPN